MPNRPYFELTKPDHAYLLGFLQTDGHLYEGTRNRGKVVLEIGNRDKEILPSLAALFPCYVGIRSRIRSTNYANHHSSSVMTVNDYAVREELKSKGLIAGAKSGLIAPPSAPYTKPDYFRGVVDGDGSLGVTANGYPFISLVTASKLMAQAFVKFIAQLTGSRKTFSRNTRDGVFNISVFREPAQQLISTMYYQDCLALTRKMSSANNALLWRRSAGMTRVLGRKVWTVEEDRYVSSHSITESMSALGRTRKSVNIRRWRLKRSPHPIITVKGDSRAKED